MAESNFEKLKNKIESKGGYSSDVARKIAAKIGDKKLGVQEMARRSAASRKRHEAE